MNKSNWIYLSHTLSTDTPGYGGRIQFSVKKTLQMDHGDSCNQSEWTMSNHIGTHLDAPFHFSPTGKKIQDYIASSWIFQNPFLVNFPASPSQIIEPGEWSQSIPNNTDLLLLKTGFEKKRTSEEYWAHNPGLSPHLGLWLREHRPTIRAIGFDFISATSFDHRALGKQAHQAFLHGTDLEPILIVEDMRFAELSDSPKMVVILPVRVQDADGSPVTVVAQI